jgi:hypothetical protein
MSHRRTTVTPSQSSVPITPWDQEQAFVEHVKKLTESMRAKPRREEVLNPTIHEAPREPNRKKRIMTV